MTDFMKADFSPDGVLRVYASTNAEAYALKAWEAARKNGRAKIELYPNDRDWLPASEELMEMIKKESSDFKAFLEAKKILDGEGKP